MTKMSTGKSWVFLILVLIVSTLVRYYNINYTVIFQGDQGRDAEIVSRIFKNADLIAIGPTTSVGNLYLGPFYYYFMMPFLWLSYPSPFGPVYAMAAFGVVTVFLMYWWGRDILDERAGLLAAAMSSIMVMLIRYSRFSWNPNPVPLVTLAMMYCTYKALKTSVWYWVGVAVCFSILLQLHYITILLATGAGLCWLFQVIQAWWLRRERSFEWRKLILATMLSVVVVIGSFIPVIAFDIKHNGLNSSAFIKLFTKEKILTGETQFNLISYVKNLSQTSFVQVKYVGVKKMVGEVGSMQSVVILIVGAGALLAFVKSQDRSGRIMLWCYLVAGFAGIGLYKYALFDHYLLYLLPPVILLWADSLAWYSRRPWGVSVAIALLTAFTLYNVQNVPFKGSDWTIFDMKRLADETAPRIRQGERYDLILLSESGDVVGSNYRYFLSTSHTAPIFAQSADELDALVIVNENYRDDLWKLSIPLLQSFPRTAEIERFPIAGGPEVIILRKK
jgi:4-amino-4-deoxy-L-arabinose transferase-like glycosyltransferase